MSRTKRYRNWLVWWLQQKRKERNATTSLPAEDSALVWLDGTTYEDDGTTYLQDSISHTPDTYSPPTSTPTSFEPSGGTTYYVDFTNGSDSNNGTSESTPFKHPPKSSLASSNSAGASLSSGDQILLKRGEVWTDTLITLSGVDGGVEGIKYGEYGTGDLPIVSARTYPTTGWTADGNEYYQSGVSTDPVTCFDGDTALTEGSGVGSLSASEWYFDSGNSRVYVRLEGDADPSGRSVNYPSAIRTLYILSSSANIGFEGIVFEAGSSSTCSCIYLYTVSSIYFISCTIQKGTVYQFRTLGTNDIVILDNCTLMYTDGIDLRYGGTDTNFEIKSSTLTSSMIINGSGDILISNNTLYGATSNPKIHAAGTSAITVEYNQIYNCTIGISVGSGHSNSVIRANTIQSAWNGLTYGSGSGLGYGIINEGDDTVVLRNTIKECYVGIHSSTTSGVLIHHNVFNQCLVNCLEVRTESPDTAEIYNNTFYHSPDPDVVSNNGHAVIVRTEAATKKAIIKNNIIYIKPLMTGVDGLQIDDTADDVTISNNIYYEDATTADGNLLYYNSTVYDSDFAGWETATGDSGSSIADPKFVDPDNDDFSLQSDSPAINAGVDIFADGDGDQYDAAGNKVWDDTYDTPDGYWINGVDIGAYSGAGTEGTGYHFSVESGDSWTDWVIKAPLAPELLAADSGVDDLFNGAGAANEIDATDRAGFTGDQSWFSTGKGFTAYDSEQDTETAAKIDKFHGM